MRALFYRSLYGSFDFCVKMVLRHRNPLEIQGGLFKGMRWGMAATCGSLTPKLMGTYEQELQSKMGQFPVFDLVIDVGAAEGWYAVGLLHRRMAQKVVAFEMSADGRENLLANVRRNNLPPDSIEIRGECTADGLQTMLRSLPTDSNFRLLIICDCEGFEGKLLDDDTLKFCANAYFTIETHNFYVPEVHERLAKSLAASHTVTDLRPVRRRQKNLPTTVPWLFRLPPVSRLLMAERRCPNIAWLVAVPKAEAK